MNPSHLIFGCALVFFLAYSVEGLSIPDVYDKISSEFAASDKALKLYTVNHNKDNREKLKNRLPLIKKVFDELSKLETTKGLFHRLKLAYEPVMQELISEIEGALGVTQNTPV